MTSNNNQIKTIQAVINALSLSNGAGVVLLIEEGELKVIPISENGIAAAKEFSGDFRKKLNGVHKKIARQQEEIDHCLKSEKFVNAVEAINAASIEQENHK